MQQLLVVLLFRKIDFTDYIPKGIMVSRGGLAASSLSRTVNGLA